MNLIASSFLTVICMGFVVILISRALDFLWAKVLPMRFLYVLIRAPGVIVHEISHVLGCLITGARIKKVVYFSEEGGSVTYTSPKIPYIGDLIINTAPLFFLPLVLAACTWIFSEHLGCVFPPVPLHADSADALFGLFTGILGMFTVNLITRFNPWFLLYLYLTLTVVLSVAPSTQDIRNAAIGISIIAVAGILILWSSFPPAVSILEGILNLVSTGFTLGLLFGIISLLISTPLAVWFMHKKIQDAGRPL